MKHTYVSWAGGKPAHDDDTDVLDALENGVPTARQLKDAANEIRALRAQIAAVKRAIKEPRNG